MMEYIIILIIAAVLLGAALVVVSKAGKKDGICKYDRKDDDE